MKKIKVEYDWSKRQCRWRLRVRYLKTVKKINVVVDKKKKKKLQRFTTTSFDDRTCILNHKNETSPPAL